jgi:hypothetical protein
VKSNSAAKGTRSASSSRERLRSLAIKITSPFRHIERIVSGSATSSSSRGNSDLVLSDESTNDDQ